MQERRDSQLSRRHALQGIAALGLGASLSWRPRRGLAQEATPVPRGLPACAADPRLGSVVSVTGPEGTEVVQLVVDRLTDPFVDYDPAGAPQPGQRFVVLRLAAEITGPRPARVDPSQFLLQDSEGYLYQPVQIRLPRDAAEALLARVDLSPGSRVEGMLGYSVLRDAQLARFFYQPERLRLLLLADLRDGGDDSA